MAQTSKAFVAANQDFLRTAAALGEMFGRTPAEMLSSLPQTWALNVAAANALAEARRESADSAEGADGKSTQDVYW